MAGASFQVLWFLISGEKSASQLQEWEIDFPSFFVVIIPSHDRSTA
jgi:hypothetical protein